MSAPSAIPYTAYPSTAERNGILLAVEDLTIEYSVGSDKVRAVDGVSFSVAPGEIVGLLGESGCGKTTTALSALRLLPETATVISGHWHFRGCDPVRLTERELRELRGAEISIIFQDSVGLNPVMRSGTQVVEVLRAHRDCSLQEARAVAKSVFDSLGLVDFDRIFNAYPHQLSGGERQRIAIAQALICQPSLVIADEPTAHVDVKTSEEVLACMKKMRDTAHTAFIVISHDPDVLGSVADRIIVMYAGQIVEQGPAKEVLLNPLHPYTHALLECSLDQSAAISTMREKKRFPFIPGSTPDPLQVIPGCCFSPRCPDRMPVCDSSRPAPLQLSSRRVCCFKYEAD
jgi:peptide/nickel transport system ATP-binding protein